MQLSRASLVCLAAVSCAGVGSRDAVHAGRPGSNGRDGAAGGGDAIAWDYDIAVDASLDLEVKATLHGPVGHGLRVDDAAKAYVDRLEREEDGAWRSVALDDARLATACARTCRLRYRFRLREAAQAIADPDIALAAGGAVFAPPSTWLVRASAVPAGQYRFRVTTTAPVSFATGIHASPDHAVGTYQASADGIEESAYAAFGALRRGRVLGADPGIEWVAAPQVALTDDVITRWLRGEVDAITGYFGRVPAGRAVLFLAPGTSSSMEGKTLGGGGASVFVRIAPRLSPRAVQEHWVVAHEMVHVASPDVGRRYSWFSEGLATYVEPIARERVGLLTREKVWSDMLEGLPQGVPADRDRGLDGTRAWNRMYWGGALYFFVADVRIRERTGNRKGLEDAMRAVVATGGDVTSTWPIERVIAMGDAATGTTVLLELHEELGRKNTKIDLDGLLRRLGVRREHGTVHFDDAAPLASIRDAIVPVRPARPAP